MIILCLSSMKYRTYGYCLFRRDDDNEPEEPEDEEDDDEEIEPELEDDDEDDGGDEEERPEVTLEEASGLKLKLKKSTNAEDVFKYPGTGSRKRVRGSEDAGRARKRSSRYVLSDIEFLRRGLSSSLMFC